MKEKLGFLRRAALVAAAAAISAGFLACAKTTFSAASSINVITREEGSGTRSAFVELFGVEEKNAAGEKIDRTITSAAVSSSTGVVLTAVSGDINAIGYISLGALSDSVKALSIDGVMPTIENVKAGTYKAQRPFILAAKGELSASAKDFMSFILSAEGQAVVEANGYVSVGTPSAYTGSSPDEKVVVVGSSSVAPLMEKLREAYIALNPSASIEVQQNDSSSGIKAAAAGTADLGMSSRELKDSELAEGLQPTVIASDGIAVIVNKSSTLSGLSSAQVKAIYVGEATVWSDVGAD